jgi:hypothetical protein
VLFGFDLVRRGRCTGGFDKWLAAAPASHFFCAQIEARMQEIILLLDEFSIEPLIELNGTLVLRFLFGK